MTSTFFALNIGQQALDASQTALQVVANNTSNVNTPGFSRQEVNFTESTPYTMPTSTQTSLGQLGTGVTVSSVMRVTNSYINTQVNNATSQQGSSQTLSTLMSQVQTAFNEPSGSGIGQQMTNFFNSFSQLSTTPESAGVRSTVVNSGIALANTFNSVSQQLQQLTPQINSSITTTVGQVNNYAAQISTLNTQIMQSMAAGQNPNDLQDQRDQLINQLSALTSVQTFPEINPKTGVADGATNVNIGGFALVQGGSTNTLPSTTTTQNGNVGLLNANGTFIPVTSGNLNGLLVANQEVSKYQTQLDTLAYNLSTSVNSLSQSGAGLDGSTGNLFFVAPPPPPGTGAASAIAVSPLVVSNPDKIAAATLPAPPATPAPGNGDNATAIANLMNQQIIGSQTLNSYYNNTITQLGSDTQAANNQLTTNQSLVSQLQNQQSSISGVNMDNELTKMMQYQRTYQAAAKIINVADTFLDTVINNLTQGGL